MRLIDADALIKDIAESIRLADEWEKESHEKKDKHGIKCAIDTRRALLAMISRVKKSPTIEPVKHGRWSEDDEGFYHCSVCKELSDWEHRYCPNCGAKMDLKDGENE